MLKEEFLAEYGFSQDQLAKAIGISSNRITEIVNNRRRITADTALRLSLYFGNSPESGSGHEASFDFAKRKTYARKDCAINCLLMIDIKLRCAYICVRNSGDAAAGNQQEQGGRAA